MTGSLATMAAVIMSVATASSVRADRYEVDPTHTEIGFSIRHLGLTSVRGDFSRFSGSIDYDGKDMASLVVRAKIETDSIDTGNKNRDDHLRNPDFFDAPNHPEITFTSLSVEQSGSGYVLKGDLAMHGVTNEIALAVTVTGPIDDPWGNQRIGLALSGALQRHDWDVGTDGPTDRLIGKEVKIEINSEGVHQ